MRVALESIKKKHGRIARIFLISSAQRDENDRAEETERRQNKP